MQFKSSSSDLQTVVADLLAVACNEDDLATALAPLGADLAADLLAAAKDEEFSGKIGSALMLPTYGRLKAARLLLVGVGKGPAGSDAIRRAGGQTGTAARRKGAETVAMAIGALDADAATALVEGFTAGNYRFDRYKPASERKAVATSVLLLDGADAGGLARGAAIAAGVQLARDLVNAPAADIYPETLAQAAADLAGDAQGLSVEVWDAEKIRAAGMGGISAVGQASDRPARFVHMVYRPAGAAKAKLCLVGKGVTFDSGGLSIKPSDGMQTMRCDMGGAASVIGAMRAIRDLRPDVEVHGIFGAVENMINGRAYKLGDILTFYNGKTAEIHNTDAEGRLVLADCLAYASKLGMDAIVDMATLTGACVVALGPHYSGLFSRDDALAASLLQAADAAGDGLWRLPMPEHYKDMIKAEWAAMKNVGGREGGAITAALFLNEFVEGTPWAHCDIAGPAFLDKPHQHMVSGGSGAPVATLVRWVLARG